MKNLPTNSKAILDAVAEIIKQERANKKDPNASAKLILVKRVESLKSSIEDYCFSQTDKNSRAVTRNLPAYVAKCLPDSGGGR